MAIFNRRGMTPTEIFMDAVQTDTDMLAKLHAIRENYKLELTKAQEKLNAQSLSYNEIKRKFNMRAFAALALTVPVNAAEIVTVANKLLPANNPGLYSLRNYDFSHQLTNFGLGIALTGAIPAIFSGAKMIWSKFKGDKEARFVSKLHRRFSLTNDLYEAIKAEDPSLYAQTNPVSTRSSHVNEGLATVEPKVEPQVAKAIQASQAKSGLKRVEPTFSALKPAQQTEGAPITPKVAEPVIDMESEEPRAFGGGRRNRSVTSHQVSIQQPQNVSNGTIIEEKVIVSDEDKPSVIDQAVLAEETVQNASFGGMRRGGRRSMGVVTKPVDVPVEVQPSVEVTQVTTSASDSDINIRAMIESGEVKIEDLEAMGISREVIENAIAKEAENLPSM